VIIIKFLPYGKQEIDGEDIENVVNVLKSDFITQGPKIGEFEEKISQILWFQICSGFQFRYFSTSRGLFCFCLGKE
jgi:dTDP-4-amino-4,6-dideoxygalactose transaminase